MTKKKKEKDNNPFTFIDLFAGIGGFHIALHNHGGKCVFASEIDKFARKTYEHNFKKISPGLFKNDNFNKDITDPNLDYSKIPDFDILCAGFPCQAFSIAGYRQGFEDERGRGNLFFNIVDILKIKKPELFILENVKNLETHDKGRTFNKICAELTNLGYGINYKVLNASNFNLPQNRERIFIVGKKDEWKTTAIPGPTEDKILNTKYLKKLINDPSNNGLSNFKFPNQKETCTFSHKSNNKRKSSSININKTNYLHLDPPDHLKKFLHSFKDRTDWEKYYYNFKKGHFKKAVDYLNSKILENKNHYNFENWDDSEWVDEGYEYVYQWRRKYIRRNNSHLCPTLTANMGTGGHNVPLIICGVAENKTKLVRKLTPSECFALQGFDINHFYRLEKKISQNQLYKQAGNSIPLNVVTEVTHKLLELL